MKLIIDIHEELAEKGHWYNDQELWTVIKATQNGIPLEQIRAEIIQMNSLDYVEPISCEEVLEIIDKYM